MHLPAYAVRSFLIHLGMAARELPPSPLLTRRLQVIQGRTVFSRATPEQIEFMATQPVLDLWSRLTAVETNTITPFRDDHDRSAG
jgi:hypothetical protein